MNFTQLRNKMVEEQIAARGITDGGVLDAMRRVERHAFVPDEAIALAYRDCPLPIGEGQTARARATRRPFSHSCAARSIRSSASSPSPSTRNRN